MGRKYCVQDWERHNAVASRFLVGRSYEHVPLNPMNRWYSHYVTERYGTFGPPCIEKSQNRELCAKYPSRALEARNLRDVKYIKLWLFNHGRTPVW
jgi:hypothetical protein